MKHENIHVAKVIACMRCWFLSLLWSCKMTIFIWTWIICVCTNSDLLVSKNSCNFKATENGVLIISNLTTAADSLWKPTYRHPPSLQNRGIQSPLFLPQGNHECALLAPLWTDAKMDNSSKVYLLQYRIAFILWLCL